MGDLRQLIKWNIYYSFRVDIVKCELFQRLCVTIRVFNYIPRGAKNKIQPIVHPSIGANQFGSILCSVVAVPATTRGGDISSLTVLLEEEERRRIDSSPVAGWLEIAIEKCQLEINGNIYRHSTESEPEERNTSREINDRLGEHIPVVFVSFD